ncbi:hypothetical protein DSECCO2_509790 [anaerobic digester metagenome]
MARPFFNLIAPLGKVVEKQHLQMLHYQGSLLHLTHRLQKKRIGCIGGQAGGTVRVEVLQIIENQLIALDTLFQIT